MICEFAADPRIPDVFSKYENDISSEYYSTLIHKVSEHLVLTEWIQKKIKDNPRIINLTSKDWKEKLKNNPIFQEYMNGTVMYLKHENKTKKQISNLRIIDYAKYINVLAVGSFKILKLDETIRSSRLKHIESLPIQLIGEIMSLNFKKNILHNCAFFFSGCKGLCLTCRDHSAPKDNVWCIQDAIVYREGSLKYASRQYCECLFDKPSKAIVHLEINIAFLFGDYCKIGGHVKSIIFIDDIFNDVNDHIVGVLNRGLSKEGEEIEEEGYTNNLKRKIEETANNSMHIEKDLKNDESVSKRICTDKIISIPKNVIYTPLPSRNFRVVQDSIQPMPEEY